ncbi:MAG TPA: glycosyltransferase family 2 protein [Bryobacteraceae bacterium]|nr:glycosyltransferase family 2 protein [Bryobacteraceae bacterium]
MARVGIVIVTHESAGEIGGCLDALREVPDIQVVVVDNASTDRTREEVVSRGTALIENSTNLGFGAAVNQGVRATTAPLLLLLNPDARLERGLDALIAEFDDHRIGAAGGLLIGADGKPQQGFMARNLPSAATLACEVLGVNSLWPRNPLNWHYRCFGMDPVTPAFVEQPAGAFLMFPRRIWEKVGGFGECYWPIWFEDVDFCWRVKQAGALVRYNPAAVAKHAGAHSVGSLPLEIRERYWYGSLLEYAARHYSLFAYWSVCAATIVGSALRGVRAFPRDGFKAVLVYGAVCRLALGRMFRPGRGYRSSVF